MKTIKITKGFETIVDDDDYEKYSSYKWCYNAGYAIRGVFLDGRTKKIWLHREINKTPDGYFTDHINGNRLDNRKENLRTVLTQQNSFNRPKRSDSSSIYKGVYFDKRNKQYVAYIKIDGKNVYLGQFSTDKEAAEAYNKKAKKLFGEYAKLNDIPLW